MQGNIYRKLLYAILLTGTIGTIVHAAYAVYLYQHCSIIAFIANGG